MTYFNEIKMQDIRYLLVLVPVACCWVWMTGEYFQMMLGEKKEKKWSRIWMGLYGISLILTHGPTILFPDVFIIKSVFLVLENMLCAVGVVWYPGGSRKKLLTAGAWLIGMNGMLLVVTMDVIYFENEILRFVFLEQAALFGCFLWKGIRLRKQGQQSQSLYQFEMSALPLTYGVFQMVFCRSHLFWILSWKAKTAFVLIMLLLDVGTVYLGRKMEDYRKKEEETRILRDLVDACSNQITLMQESQQKMKALRHGLKHHLVELKNLAKNKEDEKLQAYIEEMEQFLLNPSEHCATGNTSVDTILNDMLEKAEQNGCQVETKLQIPENWYEGNFSFCVIVGNLLDNAIREAARSEEKRLFVGICEKQGVLMIQVKNSYNKEAGGKREGEHGYGIENIERVVTSLDGEFTHEQEDGWYEANVMLYSRNLREGVTA